MNDHTFCRGLLTKILVEVCRYTSAYQRKFAWAWRSGDGRGTCDFHYLDFHWHGRACCLYHAKAQGWEAWLSKLKKERGEIE